MRQKLKILFLCSMLFSLNACNTHNRVRNQAIVQQLNQYIGQEPNTIIQHLNLQNIGISFTKQPSLKENQLIYTFQRQVATPIPTGISIKDENGRMIQTQTATTSDTIKNPLNCNIIFDIENGIAKSYQFIGRGC